MILDKTSLEELLYTDGKKFYKAVEEKKDAIYIRTDTEQNLFSPSQIGNDSIDLRISNYGYIMRTEYNYINTLSDESFEKYFKKIELKEKGYILKPQQLLFVPTYERIALSGNLIGRVTGRSVFARMGLSVHCTQDKFSSGINSVAGLQIVNNSPMPLKIFPHQMLAQILIEKTGDNRHPYKGTYCEEKNYTLPVVTDKDRKQYDTQVQHLITKQIPKKRSLSKIKKTNLTLNIGRLVMTALSAIFMGIFGIIGNIWGLIATGVLDIGMSICFTLVENNWMREENIIREENNDN